MDVSRISCDHSTDQQSGPKECPKKVPKPEKPCNFEGSCGYNEYCCPNDRKKCVNTTSASCDGEKWEDILMIDIRCEDPTCGEGFVLAPGDIPGWGQIRGRIKTDAKGCAKLCSNNKDCCSYEYSPRKKRCNLNRDCKPSRKKFEDFNFCAKGNLNAGCFDPPRETGLCKAAIPRWTFEDGECQYFVYGGCGGNRNRFSTKRECKRACMSK